MKNRHIDRYSHCIGVFEPETVQDGYLEDPDGEFTVALDTVNPKMFSVWLNFLNNELWTVSVFY